MRAQTDGAMESIRRYYGVPAHRGKAVKYKGRPAVITSAIRNTYLRLRFDGMKTTDRFVYHPLFEIDYLDGIDYYARYLEREEAFNRSLRPPVQEREAVARG